MNKALAMLQRDGFPVPNIFVNHKMGPYDKKIDVTTEQMEKDHILSIDAKPTNYSDPIYIYSLTREGEKYYQENAQEILESYTREPYVLSLQDNYKIIKDEIKLKTNNLVEKVHTDLYLDDLALYLQRVKETNFMTKRMMCNYEKRFDDGCPICLELLGALDFSQRALEIIERDRWTDKQAGKNFILYNSERLLKVGNLLRNHNHINDGSDAKLKAL